MRVLFVSFEFPPKTIGGMGTYAESLVSGLRALGIEVYVITRGDKTFRDNRIYRVFTSNRLYWRRFSFTKEAVSLVSKLERRHEFNLIHLNGTYPVIKKFNLPTISTFHALPNVKQFIMGLKSLRGHRSVNDITYLALKNPIGSLSDIMTVKVSDGIICPTPILARDLKSYCFVDEHKIHVVPNGVDLRLFDMIESLDSSFLEKFALQEETFLLYMGRLSFAKGVQHLIEAFKIVKNQHPELKLVVAGSGDFEFQLKRIAKNIDGIVFLGQVKSIEVKALLYRTSMAVVLPSHLFEVLPIALLEGMAYGKPVLATNVDGNSFLIRHGQNGFLSKPKDPDLLAKYITILYEDRSLRRKMGMCGRKLVEREFTLDKMLEETLKTYHAMSRLFSA